MKTIQINKNTFDAILIPDHLHATPRPWLFTRQVESLPALTKGQRLKWVPDDPEKPQGEGTLQVVDVPVPVPSEVTRYNFLGQLAAEVNAGTNEDLQTALAQAGTVKALLMHMVSTSDDIPDAIKPTALNEIEEAKTFRRDHPFINLIGPAFGYVTDEQKDQFFIRAQGYKFGA